MTIVAPEPLAFDELGWRQFFDLCAAVFELDAGVEAKSWVGNEVHEWHVTVPAGVEPAGGPALPGPCYVRSVWVPDRPQVSKSAALERELSDAREALASEEWTGSVMVLTNYAGVFADRSRVAEFFDSEQAVVLGPGWLSGRVDGSAALRRSMPSLLGLGDLDRWVAAEARGRSTLDIGAARALSPVFVPTRAYARALAVLEAHRFAVLTGPPEMGKTAIARMIALALMTDGWEAFECTTPEAVVRAFDGGRRQVFVADDAFGSTEFRPEAAERWARKRSGSRARSPTRRSDGTSSGCSRICRDRYRPRMPSHSDHAPRSPRPLAAIVLVGAVIAGGCSSSASSSSASSSSTASTAVSAARRAPRRTAAAIRHRSIPVGLVRERSVRSTLPARPLAGKVVGIDPGHNGRSYTDPSFINHIIWNGHNRETCDTTGTSTDAGYTEARFNFNVATYLAADLRAEGAKVVLTRKNNNGIGPCVTTRAAIINRAHASVAIDIHADGGPADGRGFAILEPVADGPNDRVIGASKKFGHDLLERYRAVTKMPVSTYDGVGGITFRDDLAGLNLTTVPKVLIECGNMRNATDAALLIRSSFQKLAAKAFTEAITQYLTARG